MCRTWEGDSCWMGRGRQRGRAGEAAIPAGPTSLVQQGQISPQGALMLGASTSGSRRVDPSVTPDRQIPTAGEATVNSAPGGQDVCGRARSVAQVYTWERCLQTRRGLSTHSRDQQSVQAAEGPEGGPLRS